MGKIVKIRRRYVFYGRVQGVGFRYRAQYIASNLGLTGWVRNCYDGSVEMEVQGIEEGIDKMIQMLDGSRYIVIENITMKNIPVLEESGFYTKSS